MKIKFIVPINLLILIGLLHMSINAIARPVLGPPSIQLRSNLANIIVAQFIGIESSGKLEFKKLKDLHNEEEDNVVVINASQDIASKLTINESYIIGYISWYTTSKRPRKTYKRPAGAILQNITGAQPAIYKYSKNIEKFITWDMQQSLKSPKKMLPIIMHEIDNSDQQIQDFFVTEIITRKNIHKRMNKADFKKVFNVMRSPLTNPKIKQLIISEGLFLKTEIDHADYCQVLNDILRHTPTKLDNVSYVTSLIRVVFVNLTACENFKETDINVLARWAFSNNRAVIESALEAINKLQPQATQGIINKALTQTLLNKATRETLVLFQKRLQ